MRNLPKTNVERISDECAHEGVLEELASLLEAGLSPSQPLDCWAVRFTETTYGAFTRAERAEILDVIRQAIGGAVGNARDVLDERE